MEFTLDGYKLILSKGMLTLSSRLCTRVVMSGELVQHPDAPKTKKYPTSTGKIGFPDFSGIPEKYPENRFWPDFSRPPATFANTRKIPFQYNFERYFSCICESRRRPEKIRPPLIFPGIFPVSRKSPVSGTCGCILDFL